MKSKNNTREIEKMLHITGFILLIELIIATVLRVCGVDVDFVAVFNTAGVWALIVSLLIWKNII